MYQVSVQHHFDAAHCLRGYGGRCEKMHGHRFQVVVRVEARELDSIGLAFDFTELRGHLRSVVDRFDHVCLNDIAPFDRINPSSENIAVTVYEELRNRLGNEQVSIASVEVWESPESCATYIP